MVSRQPAFVSMFEQVGLSEAWRATWHQRPRCDNVTLGKYPKFAVEADTAESSNEERDPRCRHETAC